MADSVNPIRISIVIPTLNRRHVLKLTLPGLLAQDFPPEAYEIIIVVDGSTDGTVQMLGQLRPACAFHVLELPRRGPSAARNLGIQAAAGELVLLLDDDFICGPTLLRAHVAAHADSEPVLVHGRIQIEPESPKTAPRYATEQWYEYLYRQLGAGREPPLPQWGANSSIRREILLASRGFDENITFAEDLELNLRLGKMGVRFGYEPAAVVQELYVKSSRDYLRGHGRARGPCDLYIARKHPDFRPRTVMSGLAETRWWKRWARNAAVQAPISPVPLIALALRLEKGLSGLGPMRRTGVRLLKYATVIEQLRSALGAAGSWKALQSEFGRKLPVLLYHHVGPARPGALARLTISPDQFERDMRWLARRGFVGIGPSDWLRWLQTGTGLPDKPVLVTFDDGYADTADYALPVLRRHGFSAAVFVVTGQLGGTNSWDEAQGVGTLRLMSGDQIREWAGRGIEFGSHSRTHADLTKLSDTELDAEISGSRRDLECLIGAPISSFTYPYGRLNDAVVDRVRSEFGLAFTTGNGLNYLKTDPHLLKRVELGAHDTVIDLEWRLGGRASRPLGGLRGRLKLRTRLKGAARFVLRRMAREAIK